ncbi:MAG TPA: ABC transporter permease [Vicinamibacterales bacterium]|nr:ABC transporter permease [Vicinamibacterales bacterium]
MSLTRFFKRGRWDDERARELESYIAIETDENIARGLSPAEARTAALRKIGNRTLIREHIYQMNTVSAIDNAWRDVRYGARLLRLNPGFALVAILSLALGIGANTAIFQLLDAIRIRSLPVEHPEQLVEVRIESARDGGGKSGWFSGDHPELTYPLWERLRDRQQAFSNVFAWTMTDFELSDEGESRTAAGVWVSGGFFDTLGVRPVLGRLLADADDTRGCGSPPVVIGFGFWQSAFGGSPAALGRSLTLDGHEYEIVGVTPASFSGIEVGRAFDVAVPLCAEPYSRGARSALSRADAWFLDVVGRLKPGWPVERATAHLEALSPALFHETVPSYSASDARAYEAFRLGAFAAGNGLSDLRRRYESPLWLLLGIAGLVLLIACANLANLMLARATARSREIAVRLALGASRTRIVRQLIAESALVAAIGAAAAAAVGRWLSHALIAALSTAGEPIAVDLAADWRLFAFVGTLACAACLLFGVVPALRATAASPGAAIKAGGRGTIGADGFGLRRGLVIAQVALSLVLAFAALLFVRSFQHLATVDTGFAKDQLLIARVAVRRTDASSEQLSARYVALLERIRRAPGVIDAARVRNVPIGGSFSDRQVAVDGVERSEQVNYNSVSDRYFATVGTALLAGRDFDRRDTATSPRVAIVTESFARVFFGGGSPIGRTFQIVDTPGKPRPAIEIVGVARDSKYAELRERILPLMYVPVAQDDLAAGFARLLIRSSLPPTAVTREILSLARETQPSGVVTFRTMATQLDDSLVRERLMAGLSAVFGGLAVLIAAIGLFGVLSYMVASRRTEIGVRMALGADRRQIVRMVMREAILLLAAGTVIGMVTAVACARLASTLLFELKPGDPATLASAAAGFAVVALAASGVPAMRASRVPPTDALREM